MALPPRGSEIDESPLIQWDVNNRDPIKLGNMMWYLVRALSVTKYLLRSHGRSQSTSESTSRETSMGH